MNSAQLHVVITGAVCLAMTAVLAALVRFVVIPLCDADEGYHARPRRWARMRRRLRAARYLPWEWWWTVRDQWAHRPHRVLRRRMTPEAVQPMLPPLQGIGQRVTWGAVKARRGTLSPGLPGPRRLGVRSRLRRRALPPADAHTVALFQQMAGHHDPHPALARMVTLRALTLYFREAAWAAEQACPRLDYAEAGPLADWLSDTWVGGMTAITIGGQQS